MRQVLLIVPFVFILGYKPGPGNKNQTNNPVGIASAYSSPDTSGGMPDFFKHSKNGIDSGMKISLLVTERFSGEEYITAYVVKRIDNNYGHFLVAKSEYDQSLPYGTFYLVQYDKSGKFIKTSEIGRTETGEQERFVFQYRVSSDTLKGYMYRFLASGRKPFDTFARSYPLNEKNAMNFLDSVMAELDLSYDQIRSRTNLDSFMYEKRSEYGGQPTFSGVSVYFGNKKYPMVILDYLDGLVCGHTYLFVYRRGDRQKMDYKEVKTECDHDQSARWESANDFEIINDSSFYVCDHLDEWDDDSIESTFTTEYCVINKDGKIEVRLNTEVRSKRKNDREKE